MRYFIELAYDGFPFSGFQIQKNAVTIQSTVEKALQILLKKKIALTGSSRTDAQVHAHQNFFHFDSEEPVEEKNLYNLNAILPPSIFLRHIYLVADDTHARFSAIARTYQYKIIREKNPFLHQKAFYYPFQLNFDKLTGAAAFILEQSDFTKFCKANAQVNNYQCRMLESGWEFKEDGVITYKVTANRFLRGMVKALVGTMLQYGTGKISEQQLKSLFNKQKTAQKADFSPPGYALYLCKVTYPENIFLT